MDPQSLAKARPYLFHLTARENFPRIRRVGRLESAELLGAKAGQQTFLAERRRRTVEIRVDDDAVLIRDQLPLHQGNMDLQVSAFKEFLAELNRRVFFWTGSASGPSRSAKRHLRRYLPESPIMLRVPTEEVLRDAEPELCRYNSGSPRYSRGRPSPRGRQVFIPLSAWSGSPSDVVEVTFVGAVVLPASTQWSEAALTAWNPLRP